MDSACAFPKADPSEGLVREKSDAAVSGAVSLVLLHPRLAKARESMILDLESGGDNHRESSAIEAKRMLRRSRATSSTPFCRYKEFRQMPRNDPTKPCVRISSPYKSSEDADKEEYKTGKQKWVSKRTFVGCASTNAYKMIANYVGRDPSDPPVLHQFRPENKKRWLSGAFK